jgi:acetoin utilization deacetylase AcuC-like enzyme
MDVTRWTQNGRRWRRRLLRFVPRRHGAPVEWVYSRRYAVDLDSPVVDRHRGQRVLTLLDQEGILRQGDLHRTRRVSLRKLLRVHDPDYLRSLESADGLSRVIGHPVDGAAVDDFLLAQRAMVGGTVLAARLALRDRRVLFNLGGGLHHALPERGQGFCLFHDIAVAIAHLRARKFEGRILVIDLDLHDGEGTRRIFAEDPSVHTLSIHNRHLDDVEAVESTSVELGTGVDDEFYLRTIDEIVPRVVADFRPDFVFYLAGADPAHDDRLGDWQISPSAMLARDRRVMRTIRPDGSRLPVVILLAGGYGHQAWRYTARFATWLATGRAVEPPTTAALPITDYRRLARHLSEPMFLAEPAEDDDWGLTEDDLPGPNSMAAKRLLGRYTVHGVELALERVGFLRKVRSLGYEHVVLEADFDNPLGDTLRLVAATPDRPVLMELRGRIERKMVPGLRVLFVEWMLSQNPRSDFPVHRPGLSGQKHPGTGLLRDVASLLLLACEHLGLDGLAYVPSHVALAVQSAGLAGFVDVEFGRHFHAALRAVRGRPFLERVRLLEAGAVVDRETGQALRWEPTTLLVPVSDEAKRRVDPNWTLPREGDPVYEVVEQRETGRAI